MSRETQSTAVYTGKLILKQALTAYQETKKKQAMKFKILGFYSSGAFFQARGPGKVLSFYHGTLSTALIKSTDQLC